VHDELYQPTRDNIMRHKMFCLPEEPLQNTCVGRMSVAENLAFRNFDVEPHAVGGWLMNRPALRRSAHSLIERYNIKPPYPDTPIQSLSGGNVQRAVLARELSAEVKILIVANPCFGLDFLATEEIRLQIVAARNRGTAVLLVSEDLDEILELADRVVVMFNGQLVYETTSSGADLALIGRHMTGHST
jgi:simple sugar transport system ATP-binding protein